MKKPRQRILYDNYDLDFEGAKEEAIERYYDFCDSIDKEIEDDYEPNEEKIWETAHELDGLFWEEFQNDFEKFIGNDVFIIQGNIGRWNGVARGGFTFSSLDELSRAWKDCDYIKVYDENGHLYIECSHHDGINFYEIRKLTEKGRKYLNNHNYYDKEELHNKLMKNPYSVLPNYANKVWGSKKIEYEAVENIA